MGTYAENYAYDAAGNLLSMGHVVSSGNWTRRYAYSEPSQITAAETGNRLTATSLPGDPAAGPFTATYAHDAHGNMTRMPHLSAMTWDEDDRLRSTTPNAGGTPQVTWYAYDAGGQRVRKATDQPGTTVLKSERICLGAIEVYREYGTDGTPSLERETLHVSDGDQAVALAENRTKGTDKGSAALFRYQHSNHLGSAVLELEDKANIITYEEYFPYGSTSYQAVTSQMETPKRYRYTGKERDEENDLYYHGARYYAPWLARWVSCDPDGLRDGTDPYSYARNSPSVLKDGSGRAAEKGAQVTRYRNTGLKFQEKVEEFISRTGKAAVESEVRIPEGRLDIVHERKTPGSLRAVEVTLIDIGNPFGKYRNPDQSLNLGALLDRLRPKFEQVERHIREGGIPEILLAGIDRGNKHEVDFVRWLAQGIGQEFQLPVGVIDAREFRRGMRENTPMVAVPPPNAGPPGIRPIEQDPRAGILLSTGIVAAIAEIAARYAVPIAARATAASSAAAGLFTINPKYITPYYMREPRQGEMF